MAYDNKGRLQVLTETRTGEPGKILVLDGNLKEVTRYGGNLPTGEGLLSRCGAGMCTVHSSGVRRFPLDGELVEQVEHNPRTEQVADSDAGLFLVHGENVSLYSGFP